MSRNAQGTIICTQQLHDVPVRICTEPTGCNPTFSPNTGILQTGRTYIYKHGLQILPSPQSQLYHRVCDARRTEPPTEHLDKKLRLTSFYPTLKAIHLQRD